jgi:hypothetical protein
VRAFRLLASLGQFFAEVLATIWMPQQLVGVRGWVDGWIAASCALFP